MSDKAALLREADEAFTELRLAIDGLDEEAMGRVWSPEGPWRALLQAQLRKHRIAYELL